MGSGGVASLNHRLQSGIPPGCVRGSGPVCIAGRRKMVERGTSLAEEDDPVDPDATGISDIRGLVGIEGGVAQRRDGAATILGTSVTEARRARRPRGCGR